MKTLGRRSNTSLSRMRKEPVPIMYFNKAWYGMSVFFACRICRKCQLSVPDGRSRIGVAIFRRSSLTLRPRADRRRAECVLCGSHHLIGRTAGTAKPIGRLRGPTSSWTNVRGRYGNLLLPASETATLSSIRNVRFNYLRTVIWCLASSEQYVIDQRKRIWQLL